MLPDRTFAELFAPEPITETRARTNERRCAVRVPLQAEVLVGAEGQFFAGSTIDVSERGLFIATRRVLPVGTRITLEIQVSEAQVLARGTVRWLRKGSGAGLGVELDPLSDVDATTLANACTAALEEIFRAAN